MTLPLKITTLVLAATIVVAGALTGGLVLMITIRERNITDAERWEP